MNQQMSQAKWAIRMIGGSNPQTDRFFDGYIKVVERALDGLMRDGDLLVTGIDLSSADVGITDVSQFNSGSEFSKIFAASPSEPPSFDGLSNRSYIFAMSAEFVTISLKQWWKELAAVFGQDDGWPR